MDVSALRLLIILGGLAGVAFVLFLIHTIRKEEQGEARIRELSRVIRSGSFVFLRREYVSLAVFTVIVTAVLAIFVEPKPLMAVAYLAGTIISAFAGWVGMNIATMANGRTAHAAIGSWAHALSIAFRSGAVMGFSVVSLGLLGLAAISMIWQESHMWLGFAFGASSVALFLRVGGGIFTKSADVGADLVGKVEHGIPEDDQRNPAVIADNVGDNVGDVAGMGSDLFESYVSSIAAAMVLGISSLGFETAMYLPLLLAAAGIVASIAGALSVRPKNIDDDFSQQILMAHKTMTRGVYVSNILMVIISFIIFRQFAGSIRLFWALVSGLAAGFLISVSTEYYTSADHGPTKKIAQASESGSAVLIIEGLAQGLMSTVMPVLLIIAATITAYLLSGLLGIAIAAMGMLINLGMLLSMDCYGPIADNAAGISQMANLGKQVRSRCEALDSVGNTTAALGKGFAVGSAALASLAWLATYFEVAEIQAASITQVDVVVGVMLGSVLTFVFCALALQSVSKGGFEIVSEVRRQFKEIKGLLEGESSPDYDRCVDLATKTSLKSMLLPGVLVLIVPLLLGFTLGKNAVAGLLLGSLVTGFVMAILMANSGGAWDNAKKYIESGEHGGSGSEAHNASVIGDTVGDPLKDTAGPSLNILIKLVGKVAVIFGSMFVALLHL
jgi:K(+)-stimulated pyrophosphate-energized sodium pump